ncbi:MAG: N-acetylmuramate alpha-1-phosphate uridylyltransferase MurU [Lysobacterales bacterium]
MKALILAAGRGERMRPLTLTTPKPLLRVGGKSLIEWHLARLATLGIRDVVVNTAWLAEKLQAALGDGEGYGLRIRYSHEGDTPLETGGALLHARPLLGEEPFLLVNGDIWTDFDFARLSEEPTAMAHLVMVPVPAHAARGDFHLDTTGLLHANGDPLTTYAGIGVYRMAVLDDWQRAFGAAPDGAAALPRFPLAPLLRQAMHTGLVSGELHAGKWTDVGTPERLAELDQRLRAEKQE